jgi:21S rRNA (uridine2791-2'-O)-methyltransferase
MAALTFSFDTLRTGGHFLCKFYQGPEDKEFETKLRRLFTKVHREKPESSRSVSRSGIPYALVVELTHPGIEGGVLCCLASEGDPN